MKKTFKFLIALSGMHLNFCMSAYAVSGSFMNNAPLITSDKEVEKFQTMQTFKGWATELVSKMGLIPIGEQSKTNIVAISEKDVLQIKEQINRMIGQIESAIQFYNQKSENFSNLIVSINALNDKSEFEGIMGTDEYNPVFEQIKNINGLSQGFSDALSYISKELSQINDQLSTTIDTVVPGIKLNEYKLLHTQVIPKELKKQMDELRKYLIQCQSEDAAIAWYIVELKKCINAFISGSETVTVPVANQNAKYEILTICKNAISTIKSYLVTVLKAPSIIGLLGVTAYN